MSNFVLSFKVVKEPYILKGNFLHGVLQQLKNIQLLDEAEQNIVIYQWRADQLFTDAEGRGK